jgi:hypothetical protein
MYLDDKGLIEQSDGDGGDKLGREGFWYEGCYLNPAQMPIPGMAPYYEALVVLTDANGNLQRDEIKYTAILDPNDVSRDQLSPTVRACGYYDYNGRVKTILKNILKNYSRYPNGDLAFITDYARIARALYAWYLLPLLYVADLYLLGSTLFSVVLSYFDKANKYVGDNINLIGDLAQSNAVLPTLFAWLSKKLFKLRRNGPMYGLEVYFNPSTGANEEFVDLWAPIVEKF